MKHAVVSATLAASAMGGSILAQCPGPIYPGAAWAFTRSALDMATADLNGDGFPDVVAVSHEWQQDLPLTVFVNDGYGGMSISDTVQAGREPHSVVIGDLDGDGDNDLVVSNTYDSDISVLMNNGDATFAEQVRYDVGGGPWKAALGDFDADGDLDIAAEHFYGVRIFANSGSGDFSPSQDLPLDLDMYSAINWIDSGDIDGDGDIDLAVNNCPSGGDVTVLANDGTGVFSAAGSYDTELGNIRMLQLADVDGDADLDVVAVDQDRGVKLIRNQGDGSFGPAEQLLPDEGVRRLEVGDIDGDMDRDIVVVGEGILPTLLRNDGVAEFVEESLPFPLLSNCRSAKIADFDQDGNLDLAAAQPSYSLDDSNLHLLFNLGDATFVMRDVYQADDWLEHLEAGDVDGDGARDLMFSWGGGLYLMLNLGDGSFGTPSYLAADSHHSGPYLVDIDMDGDADVVTNGTPGTVVVHESIGNGAFADPLALPGLDSVEFALFVDLEGDGDEDLVVIDAAQVINAYENLDGSFIHRQAINVAMNVDSLVAEDVDGDGDKDLAAARYASDAHVRVVLNQSDFTFELAPGPLSLGGKLSRLVLGDVDGDGDADMAVSRVGSSWFDVFFSNSDGTFADPFPLEMVHGIDEVAAGDVNTDGVSELLGLGPYPDSGGTVPVIYWQDGHGFDLGTRYLAAKTPADALTADLDNDGYNDLVVLDADPPEDAPYHVSVLLADCPSACPGDVDGDGATGQTDLGILLSCYELPPGDPLYDPRADLNGDGAVGQPDLGILLADYECGSA